MGFFGAGRVGLWRSFGCAGLVCLSVAATASAKGAADRSKTRHALVLTPWEQALRARDEFEAQPAGTHSRASYSRVLDAFRAIYHDNPRDLHAAEAVNQVAELLAEQGRELEDTNSLRNAVGQYEFLRTQYPTSPLRAPALLAEAKIEDQDLRDAALARGKYRAVIKEAPKSKSAGEAKLALAIMTAAEKDSSPAHSEDAATSSLPVEKPKPAPAAAGFALTQENARLVEKQEVPAANPIPAAETVAPLHVVPVRGTATTPHTRSGPLAQVTGIRHWSTSTYTRVAIDLGDAVTFEAARVPNPDRIYFDLHGARLGPELVGKSFSVTDDGFLKRIRAAQSSPDVTRVVLDVNDVTEYSAFLLPNPYRLIIDIHGGNRAQGAELRAQETSSAEIPANPVTPVETVSASAAANSSGLPAMATTAGSEGASTTPAKPLTAAIAPERVIPIARPVPNTVAVKAPATTTEVAAVSDAPGKIEATEAPTSKPIAVGVPAPKDGTLGTPSRRRKTTLAADAAAPAKAAEKTADGETSMIRALGLKINRIVIDAGHGGHDSGTLGADGIEEKDVVLDVALRLGKLLHDRLGAEIIYTRSDDTFIPLETRTAIANKAQADLFISIHANSSQDPTARGVETYYLNFTSDPGALDVAARENAVGGQSIHQLSDLVKKITLKDKIAESREFASDVEGSLYAGLAKGNDGLKNRGVKKAPFVVLIGANMPSILAEISFVTNPRDAAQLRQPEYRERVAESLYAGVAKYESGLAGTVKAPPVQRASVQ
jgi:N-acetylmuramoyl-L-alanine amidase